MPILWRKILVWNVQLTYKNLLRIIAKVKLVYEGTAKEKWVIKLLKEFTNSFIVLLKNNFLFQ